MARGVLDERRSVGTAAAAGSRPQVPFAHKLVLNQWLLSLFNVKRFEQIWPSICATRRWKGWTRTTSIISIMRSRRNSST